MSGAVGNEGVTSDARGEIAELVRLLGEPGRAGALGGAPRARAPFALRVLDDRVLHWADGLMTILDAWSVFAYPLAGTERAALESLFALSLEGVDLPEIPARDGPATLAVFHALPVPPEEARRTLPLGAPPDSLVATRSVDVLPAPDGARLVSRSVLARAVPPEGPGESVRRTLVFHLAMELLGAGPQAR